MYDILTTIHNTVGGLTLIATLISAGLLLITSRTTTPGAAIALRSNVLLASLQAVVGIVLVVVALLSLGTTYAVTYWLHYLIGLAAVGAVSVVGARARRAPDREARRYGGMLLGVLVLVLVAFLVGQYRWTV